jgi:hypothetical protein
MSPLQSALERRVRPVIPVVDDDPGIREAFRLVLEEEYELVEAEDGPQAIERAQGSPVDLVLLDVQAVVEVLAQAAAPDGLAQVGVRGGDHAHVDGNAAGPPDALDLALLVGWPSGAEGFGGALRDRLVLEVRDTGSGIKPEETPQVFNPSGRRPPDRLAVAST